MNRNQILAIRPALQKQFYNSQEIADALEIALMGNKNLILYGPGGHAKSMMVDAAMKAAGVQPFVKSFSEGTTVDDIYGGLDIPAYTNGELKHITQNSFLNSEVAVFEELFDAPAATLCSLKDTLTAKAYRQGAEYCKSKCTTIIAITNVDPADITAMGAAQAALVERFPIQVEVKWNKYTSENYLNMLKAAYGNFNPIMDIVASMAAKTEGALSPRSCCHLYDSIQARAKVNGRRNITNEDIFEAAKFFKELGSKEELKEYLDKITLEHECKVKLQHIKDEVNKVVYKIDNLDSPNRTGKAIAGLRLVNNLRSLYTSLLGLAVCDEIYNDYHKYTDDLSNKINKYTRDFASQI